ncbi:MAG: TylF/MycF/NovP-related O-methyltransferase [Agriterribacter sp.]
MKKLIKSIINKLGFEVYKKGELSFGVATDTYKINSLNFDKKVYDYQDEALTLIRKCAPYSMGSLERMFALHHLVKYVEESKIAGDYVECGVWKGGNAALMAGCHLAYSSTIYRNVWMYDTYEGLPVPSDEDGIDADNYYKTAVDNDNKQELCIADESFVNEVLDDLKFPVSNRVIVKGLFEKTLLLKKPEKIAFLRLDGDWYESTKVCMNELYDKVVDGGIIMIDDYGAWEGCKKAIDEFFVDKGIIPLLHHVDFTCRYYIK